ncbi:MAG: ChbG/HpnK family deacetylase [Fimbriimonadales bacterium]|nr:ChbG/HpnK family deacetylase [Fimbriimonadales bacterium]
MASGSTLVLRLDDAGSCPSANRAIRDALEFGLARSVGVMVPGPAFEDAAAMLRDCSHAEVGLHATIHAEWTEVRWGPTAGATAVPSLALEDGTLTRTSSELLERGFQAEEVRIELEAQIAKAIAKGLRPRYLDEHMGFGWLPGVLPILERIASDHGLVFRPRIDPLPEAEAGLPLRERVLNALERAPAGRYLLVLHPAYDSPETRAFWHPGLERGQIARERDEEARLLTDERFRQRLLELGVELGTYAGQREF